MVKELITDIDYEDNIPVYTGKYIKISLLSYNIGIDYFEIVDDLPKSLTYNYTSMLIEGLIRIDMSPLVYYYYIY